MNRNQLLGILLWVVISHSIYSQAQSRWNLQHCIELALKNNPNVHRVRLQHEKDQISKRQSWQNILPTVEGSLSHGWNQGRTIDPTTNQFIDETITAGNPSLSSGITLFNGWRALHDIRMKANTLKTGELQLEAEKENLILDVIEAYILVLTAKDIHQQTEEQLELMKAQVQRAEIMHAEGNFSPNDYFDLQGQYSEDKNLVENAKQSLYHAQIRLAGLLHLSVQDLEELTPLILHEEVDILTAETLYESGKELPLIQVWDWRIKETKQAVKIARSEYYPSLYLNAGFNSRYSNSSDLAYWDQSKNNLGKYISFYLKIPIFNGLSVRNQVKHAKIKVKEISWQKEIALNTLREKTAKVVFDLQITEKILENLKVQEENYQESFRISQVQFDLGATNSVLYLTAKNKWQNSQNRLLIKRYEWMLQKYINDYYQGKLEI